MKLLFLFVILVAALTASSQTTLIEVPKEKIDQLNQLLKDRKFKQPGEFKTFLDSIGTKNIHADLASPGVYHLPQDNMPCIVPDMKLLRPIPNAMTPRLPFNSEIPNAAPKQNLDPKKLKWAPVYISSGAVKP